VKLRGYSYVVFSLYLVVSTSSKMKVSGSSAAVTDTGLLNVGFLNVFVMDNDGDIYFTLDKPCDIRSVNVLDKERPNLRINPGLSISVNLV